MFLKVLIFVVVIGAVVCKPQLLTFNDGKVGVNFGGYHAEAGLGGILSGNNAAGGLSASAGTPHGQRAAAGIGGNVGGNLRQNRQLRRQLRRHLRRNLNGNTLGGAYAGATAGEGIGASAGLGGSVGGGGALGANAQAGGHSRTAIKKIEYAYEAAPAQNLQGNIEANVRVGGETNAIQKIKHTKKYVGNSENHVQSPKIDTKSDVIESGGQEHNVEQQPQVFVYSKRIHPHRRRLHLRKQFVPIYYQPVQEVAEIEKIRPVNVVKTKQVYLNNPAPATRFAASAEGNANVGSFFDSIFNIPISTLRAVNGFLNQGVGGGVGVKKSVTVQQY